MKETYFYNFVKFIHDKLAYFIKSFILLKSLLKN
jgi:hypothetical protein